MPWIVYAIPVVCIVLGIPLIARKIPPNALYGYRTPTTLSDEGIWYEANHGAGKDLVLAGLLQLAVLAAYPSLPVVDQLQPRQLIVATQVPIVFIAVAHSYWRLWRM